MGQKKYNLPSSIPKDLLRIERAGNGSPSQFKTLLSTREDSQENNLSQSPLSGRLTLNPLIGGEGGGEQESHPWQ